MFNEYQLLLLQKQREKSLTREWQHRDWLHQARAVRKVAKVDEAWLLLKETILRTVAIALLVVLLALGLTNIANV